MKRTKLMAASLAFIAFISPAVAEGSDSLSLLDGIKRDFAERRSDVALTLRKSEGTWKATEMRVILRANEPVVGPKTDLRDLEAVSVSSTEEVSAAQVKSVAGLPRLRRLVLDAGLTEAVLSEVSAVDGLQDVDLCDLGHNRFQSPGLQKLARLKNLRKMRLALAGFEQPVLNGLKMLRRVDRLDLDL